MRYWIYWGNGTANSFLFGTEFRHVGRSVSFKNRMIPPGKSLKTWLSKTNYQSDRISPSLPLLKKGATYSIKLSAEMYPKNSIYIKISFIDRFGKEISTKILKQIESEFRYPTEAYSYSISLINAGCEELQFDSIVIYDEDESNEFNEDWDPSVTHYIENPTSHSDVLHVVFMEDNTLPLSDDERRAIEQWDKILLVGDSTAIDTYYLLPEFISYLDGIVNSLSYKKLYFIGYGPISNFAALYYNYLYNDSTAYISTNLYSATTYQFNLDSMESSGTYNAREIIDRIEYSNNIKSYTTSKDYILSIFDGLYFPLFKLNDFLKKEKRKN